MVSCMSSSPASVGQQQPQQQQQQPQQQQQLKPDRLQMIAGWFMMVAMTSACSICISEFLLLSIASRKLRRFTDIYRCSVFSAAYSSCLSAVFCLCISAWPEATSCPSFQWRLQGQLATANERGCVIVNALYGSLQYVDSGICSVQASQCVKEELCFKEVWTMTFLCLGA